MAKAPNNTPKANGSFTAQFKIEKETKGTYKFAQVKADGTPYTIEAGAQIGSLYIRKSAFGDGAAPQTLTITVAREG
jgi:hypothetical protein